MGGTLNNISVIECNIFTLTPILIAFYKNLDKKIEKNILLAYLVFPIVLSEYAHELLNINNRSNLSKITDNIRIMAGFEDRFNFYRELTNKCIQYALDCKAVSMDSQALNIQFLNDVGMLSNPKLNQALKVASRLFKVFKKDIISTYIQFGIYQI